MGARPRALVTLSPASTALTGDNAKDGDFGGDLPVGGSPEPPGERTLLKVVSEMFLGIRGSVGSDLECFREDP